MHVHVNVNPLVGPRPGLAASLIRTSLEVALPAWRVEVTCLPRIDIAAYYTDVEALDDDLEAATGAVVAAIVNLADLAAAGGPDALC